MQAILWLQKPVHVSGAAYSILSADIDHHDPSDKSVVVSIDGGFKLHANYESAVFHDDSIDDVLWLVSDGEGRLLPEAADVRLPAPE